MCNLLSDLGTLVINISSYNLLSDAMMVHIDVFCLETHHQVLCKLYVGKLVAKDLDVPLCEL